MSFTYIYVNKTEPLNASSRFTSTPLTTLYVNTKLIPGLSTLTNISRYDLPDPEVYRDFFRLNPVFEFKKLSDTCTYFRGCPINRLDVAIAYDLPELVGKYKKGGEALLRANAEKKAKAAPPASWNGGRGGVLGWRQFEGGSVFLTEVGIDNMEHWNTWDLWENTSSLWRY